MRLAFGPMRYEVALGEGAARPAYLDRWRAEGEPNATPVRVAVRASLPDVAGPRAFAGAGFAVERRDGEDVVTVTPAAPARWAAALAALVAHDAPRFGCAAIHCAAVRAGGGVALLLAPGGTGKTTFAAAAGARSFAHNAVLVGGEAGRPVAWALPFAGDPRPELDATGPMPVRAVVTLVRGEAAGFEWAPASEATMAVARHCVRAPLADPAARERFMIALALVSGVPVGRLRTTRGLDDLKPLDAALRTESDG